MTTDAQPALLIGTEDQLLFDRVARCCDPAAWLRSRAWLAQAGRLAVNVTSGDVSPQDWASWLLNARPSLRTQARGLVRAMANQFWRLEAGASGHDGASAQFHAAMRVGGQRWEIGLATTPQLQVITLSKAVEVDA